MSKYILKGKHGQQDRLEERGGICIDATASVDWAVNLPWNHVRDWCKRHGLSLIPVIEESNTHTFVFKGVHYLIQYNETAIQRVLADGEEITWNEFPDILKGIL
jgi:hypothetical protein